MGSKKPLLTEKQFDEWFKKIKTPKYLIMFLENNMKKCTIDLKNGEGYNCSNIDDLYAVMEAELFKEQTGREI